MEVPSPIRHAVSVASASAEKVAEAREKISGKKPTLKELLDTATVLLDRTDDNLKQCGDAIKSQSARAQKLDKIFAPKKEEALA